MALEVGIDNVEVVFLEMAARTHVLAELEVLLDGIYRLALIVQDVNGREGEAVLLGQCEVRLGVAAFANIKHVGLHQRGVGLLHQRTDQLRAEEILVAVLAEMNL